MSLLVDLLYENFTIYHMYCMVYREFYVINCNICNCLILYIYSIE